ncbi:hypothetical protein [uncultured Eubacterium sp.]|nr:hypothetical protein [uncultured Eubacterium sp.]
MMKKFEEPIIEIIKFMNSDVITTSYTGGGTTGDINIGSDEELPDESAIY